LTAGAAVKLEAIHKRFGRGPWVLRGVDLTLEAGRATAVVGGNGSGKSTLLRIVAGLSRPSRGRVVSRPASIGYAPERLPARLRMTARAYLGHMARMRGTGPGSAEAIVERLALWPGLDVPIGTLSKGNSQKVALAQALAAPAGLLLLDEPSSGLDGPAEAVLCELLAERRGAGAAILLTTHNGLDGLEPDSSLMLDRGVLLPVGPLVEAPAATMTIELRRAGRRQVVEVAGTESDAALAAALAEGWSVLSVRATR